MHPLLTTTTESTMATPSCAQGEMEISVGLSLTVCRAMKMINKLFCCAAMPVKSNGMYLYLNEEALSIAIEKLMHSWIQFVFCIIFTRLRTNAQTISVVFSLSRISVS